MHCFARSRRLRINILCGLQQFLGFASGRSRRADEGHPTARRRTGAATQPSDRPAGDKPQ